MRVSGTGHSREGAVPWHRGSPSHTLWFVQRTNNSLTRRETTAKERARVLLRFRATNHKSLRDTTELVLTKSGFDAVRPRDGDWGAVTNQVVGLFGANASGKSTVLDAMSFATFVVRTSSSWSDREEIPHKPFLLDGASSAQSSAYEFDFTVHGVRHVYGFELTAEGIASEWLSNFPEGRRRLLFERTGPEPADISFSRNLKGENVRTARLLGGKNLFLSVAAMANHPDLKRIHHQLSGHMVYADFSEGNQTRRIEAVKRWLEEERYVRQAHSLLRFADLGITRVSLEENELTPGMRLVVKRTLSALHEARGEELDEPAFTEFMEGQKKAIAFWHEAGGGAAPASSIWWTRAAAQSPGWPSRCPPSGRSSTAGLFSSTNWTRASIPTLPPR
ncbi:hypothetical protein CAC01_13980 [Streptomyces sp. CLI2509]|nr:hypothetical protein CAC01_13980 [Streptomyces sp. CLI2509]